MVLELIARFANTQERLTSIRNSILSIPVVAMPVGSQPVHLHPGT